MNLESLIVDEINLTNHLLDWRDVAIFVIIISRETIRNRGAGGGISKNFCPIGHVQIFSTANQIFRIAGHGGPIDASISSP